MVLGNTKEQVDQFQIPCAVAPLATDKKSSKQLRGPKMRLVKGPRGVHGSNKKKQETPDLITLNAPCSANSLPTKRHLPM